MSSPKVSICQILTTITTLLIIALILVQSQLLSSIPSLRCPSPPSSPTPTPIPTPPSMTRLFAPIPALEDMSSAGDAAWSTMLSTPRGGFLWVQQNETTQHGWGVSMFHGLHCLQLIRKMLQLNGVGVGDSASSSDDEEEEKEEILWFHTQQKDHGGHTRARRSGDHENHLDHGHLTHCLRYIAQSLLCTADSTIEPPWTERDAAGEILRVGVDGNGYEHRCRDPAFLWERVRGSEGKGRAVRGWGRAEWRVGDTVEGVFGL